VARYFATHFVAAHQQVGSFEVVNEFGVLKKNGGNVASYFCTPDGRVIHAVTGPVKAEELLTAARWAVDVSSDGKAAADPETIGAAHRQAMESLEHRGAGAEWKVRRLLAAQPLPPLNQVYRTIFETILGQRVSPPDTDRAQASRAITAARHAKLPILVILHKDRDNQSALEEWRRLVADQGDGLPDSSRLTGLARCYVVVSLPLAELPAWSSQLGIQPYAAPDRGSPLFVVARSDARQLSAVTTWSRTDDLAHAMAQGIVQEAKEHHRTPQQLRTLLTQVGPIDEGLAEQVLRLLPRSDQDAARRANVASRKQKRS
jgi:hypothetical protein